MLCEVSKRLHRFADLDQSDAHGVETPVAFPAAHNATRSASTMSQTCGFSPSAGTRSTGARSIVSNSCWRRARGRADRCRGRRLPRHEPEVVTRRPNSSPAGRFGCPRGTAAPGTATRCVGAPGQPNHGDEPKSSPADRTRHPRGQRLPHAMLARRRVESNAPRWRPRRTCLRTPGRRAS